MYYSSSPTHKFFGKCVRVSELTLKWLESCCGLPLLQLYFRSNFRFIERRTTSRTSLAGLFCLDYLIIVVVVIIIIIIIIIIINVFFTQYIEQMECGLALSVFLSTTIFVIIVHVVKMMWTQSAEPRDSTTNFDHGDDAYLCR